MTKIKQFSELHVGDRFEMTISHTGVVITVEVDSAPTLRPNRQHLMLRAHDIATGASLNAFGKPGALDTRKLV